MAVSLARNLVGAWPRLRHATERERSHGSSSVTDAAAPTHSVSNESDQRPNSFKPMAEEAWKHGINIARNLQASAVTWGDR